MKYVLIMLVALTLSNANTCTKRASKTNGNNKQVIQESKKDTYYINTLNQKEITKEKLYITFDKENKLISGYSGCNIFSSDYTITNDQISLGMPRVSKIYCEEKVALENEFFEALYKVKTLVVSNKNLSLKDTNGTELLSGTLKEDN